MVPAATLVLNTVIDVEEQPTFTYAMKLSGDRVQGYTDGIEAMKQAIFKILNTERYKYLIYGWDYGIELADLFGEAISYVCPELERRITEALLADDRILEVKDFQFDYPKRHVVHVSFTVETIFGEIQAAKDVNF